MLKYTVHKICQEGIHIEMEYFYSLYQADNIHSHGLYIYLFVDYLFVNLIKSNTGFLLYMYYILTEKNPKIASFVIPL